jgi:hypothetical protein
MKRLLIGSSIVASMLLIGCSGGGGSSAVALPTTTSTDTTGQLVDSYLENVDYRCGDSNETKVTDANGTFRCATLPASFYLGGLKLGQIDTPTADGQVFPQDLVGVARTDINNSAVIAMARFMQSCDEDKNPANGIKIHQQIKEQLKDVAVDFNASHLESYASEFNITLVDENTTLEHLEHTTEFVDAVAGVTRMPSDVREALLTPLATLTQEAKDTLSYMGNEERLAYDVYNKMFESFPEQRVFDNIATRSEFNHASIVQLLVKKYISSSDEFSNIDLPVLGFDSNISDIEAGKYDISGIQNLYDALVAKGTSSEQDALEVGCMVEVTDINDLLEKIEIARDSNASDVVSAFEFLRDGSYSHYWAFDRALKALGVTEGCCVVGEVDGVNYCHDEYPQGNGDDGSEARSGDGSCDGSCDGDGTGTPPEDAGSRTGTGTPRGPGDGSGTGPGYGSGTH